MPLCGRVRACLSLVIFAILFYSNSIFFLFSIILIIRGLVKYEDYVLALNMA